MAAAAVEQNDAVDVADVLQLAIFVDHDVYLARLVTFTDEALEVVRLRSAALYSFLPHNRKDRWIFLLMGILLGLTFFIWR